MKGGMQKKKRLYLGREKGRIQREREVGGTKNTKDYIKSHRGAFYVYLKVHII